MYIIGTQTATVSRMLSLDFEKTWRIVDFQTGGPTVSPLLLIYMCWKSNMILVVNTTVLDAVQYKFEQTQAYSKQSQPLYRGAEVPCLKNISPQSLVPEN